MVGEIRRVILTLILCGVVAVLASCGGAAPPVQPATTASTSAGAAAGETLEAAQQYEDQMRDWMETHFFDERGAPVEAPDFRDILQPTDGEIRDARDFAASMRDALDALKAISAPAEIADAHGQLCSALGTELSALDRMIMGIEYGNQRDMELAFRDASKGHDLEIAALGALSKYVDLAGLVQN